MQRLLEGAAGRGLDLAHLCDRAGIAIELLDSPTARVTIWQYGTLMKVLTKVLRDEMWGLSSRPVPPGTFARASLAAVQCRTLERAIRTVLGHYRLALADFSPRMNRRSDMAHLWLREKGGGLTMARSSFLLLAYGVVCWLVGRRIPLARVDFAFPMPSDQVDVQMLFQAPVHFGQQFTGFTFEGDWLNAPIRQDETSLKVYLAAAPQALIVRYRDRRSPVERVRAELRRRLEFDPSLDQIAAAVGMPSHTLTRRLREGNQTFREMKQDLRRDMAIGFLQESDLPQETIALRLGFSELSTFHRAFKEWTGVAPGVYRQATKSRD